MPPCVKCHGFIYVGADDCFCMNCSFRPPLAPIPPVYRAEQSVCSCGKEAPERNGLCRYHGTHGLGALIHRGTAAVRDCRRCGAPGLPPRVLFCVGCRKRPPRPSKAFLPVVQWQGAQG